MTISVIIPAYNAAKWLRAAVASVHGQTCPAEEIIIVDDGSTDGTELLCREFGASVRYVRRENGGLSAARNTGVEVSSGEWLLFLDADTWFEPDGLRRVLTEYAAAGRGALSLAPYHVVPGFHEQFSAFFNLVMLAGTGAFTLLGDRLTPRGLLGQFLLI